MKNLELKSNPAVATVFNNYPKPIKKKITNLRRIIIECAESLEDVVALEETLKWGEPSYLAKKGSTIRIDWKKKTPEQYAIYFKCTSKLVSSFRKVYPDTFKYENNRALIFQLEDKIPEAALKNCIKAGLRYHKVKELPLLGLK